MSILCQYRSTGFASRRLLLSARSHNSPVARFRAGPSYVLGVCLLYVIALQIVVVKPCDAQEVLGDKVLQVVDMVPPIIEVMYIQDGVQPILKDGSGVDWKTMGLDWKMNAEMEAIRARASRSIYGFKSDRKVGAAHAFGIEMYPDVDANEWMRFEKSVAELATKIKTVGQQKIYFRQAQKDSVSSIHGQYKWLVELGVVVTTVDEETMKLFVENAVGADRTDSIRLSNEWRFVNLELPWNLIVRYHRDENAEHKQEGGFVAKMDLDGVFDLVLLEEANTELESLEFHWRDIIEGVRRGVLGEFLLPEAERIVVDESEQVVQFRYRELDETGLRQLAFAIVFLISDDLVVPRR